jgi:ABC-type polysaccharide/polyol phosphate transport system ATPase subunit
MSNIVIKAEDISKQYRLGLVGTGTVKDDFKRWWHKLQGKDDPFLKIGETNDRSTKGESNYVWSLKDINFEINQGDSVGIIGKNGAGKSTLLKILSQVTQPTTGRIYTKGRIASLLEVGTGFHPEMTGRENIYLNGAILGMRKKEITRKLDEIIDFSGVERYIDTPVKRYSSGMYVRLAFAVAAYLESEILIVDEVLAVGDAEFQKKCLGKMGDITTKDGRTVLFVSHNLAAIQKLCNKGILLENGNFIVQGKTEPVIQKYLDRSEENKSEYFFDTLISNHKKVFVKSLSIEDLTSRQSNEVPVGKTWQLRVKFTVNEKIDNLIVAIGITDIHETPLSTTWSQPLVLDKGDYDALFTETIIKFNPGKYRLLIGVSRGTESIEYIDSEMFLVISDVVNVIEENVINYTSGFINNQMGFEIEKNK